MSGETSAPTDHREGIPRVRALLRPHRAALLAIIGFAAVKSAAFNGRAYLMKPLSSAFHDYIPDAVDLGTGAPATPRDFAMLAGAMAGLSLVVALMTYLISLVQKRTILRILVALRLQVAGRLLEVPIARYARERIGDLLNRFTSDIRSSETAIRVLGINVWEQSLMVTGGIITAAILSPTLTLLVLAPFIPAAVVLLSVTGGRVRTRSARNVQAQADLTQRMQQILSGMRVVKVFHTEAREAARYVEASEAQFRRAKRVARARALNRGLVEFLMNAGVAGAFLLGGAAAIFRWFGIDPPTFLAFAMVLAGIYTPLRGVGQTWATYQESLPAVARSTAVLEWEPEPADQGNAQTCPPLTDALRLERVTFVYDGGDDAALDDVTIEIPAGTVTAVVGESGAGKSTFFDLLLRLADPAAGRITWDGHDLRALARESLRNRIALVGQDPFLFHASVADNLRYGNRDATDAEVAEAVAAADASEVVAGLPDGLNTLVGERGARLSGGERQRLTIARALLRDPDLLLLDEATAALDSASESRVLTALERLMEGRTTIWVAHRLTSITRADQIVLLDEGRIAERGTHEELLAKEGPYARMWAEQQLPVGAGEGTA
ncbi:MAG: ABC transporter ATP-binding protein [Planctomycetota bacterium]|jgi:ABC-type multidrug transport system fused ATPase/permease subunit